MAEARKELKELDCSNLSSDWKNWKRDFLVYMIAKGKNDQPESTKIATFLYLIGTNGANIYNTLFPNDGSEDSLLGKVMIEHQIAAVGEQPARIEQQIQQRKLSDVLSKFDEHCLPQKNVAMESYKFNNLIQRERQTFNEFLTELRTQLERCEYKCTCGISYENRMLRDRIITGVFDKKLQLKLLDGSDETLNRVVDMCKTYEAANVNKGILDSKKQSVAAVSSSDTVNAIKRFCFNCGGPWDFKHKSECKAAEITCRLCSKKGHFQSMCRKLKGKSSDKNNNSSDKKSTENGNKKNVAGLNWGDMTGKSEDIIESERTLSSLKFVCRINSVEKGKWTKEYQIGNRTVNFKIDTGADVNCIPLKLVRDIGVSVGSQKNEFSVFDYSNNKIKIHGTVKLKCFDTEVNKENLAEFIVVDDSFEPILGLDACIRFNLIKRMDINTLACDSEQVFLKRNSELFSGLGEFPETFSIYLRDNSKPILHYKKRIPMSLVDRVKDELTKMVKDKIISPVNYPTDWVNNLQIVEKPNGKLRICLDPKPLNACIRREHFLIPTIEDLTSKLANKRVFSVLDLSSGFWHMRLDEKSSDLTTFMTPFGRFKFNRVPFGLNCAPEMFQRKMVQIFGDLPGVIVYFDDVGICAGDEQEHDAIMAMVIERAKRNNVKFNPDKIQYRKGEVKFMGSILCNGTIKPDSKYRRAILEMKKPNDKSAVLRFLGFLKYIARVLPNLSRQTANLRNLTRNDVPFEWNDEHEREFQNLLKIVASNQVLAIYDPHKATIVQTDASKDGLGCVLIQEGRPVAFASRTLSISEQKWAQIEKELLAIVFACQRFHYFLYGCEFVVESDHKPLETLILRDIDDVTMRLQRMFMFLLKYPGMNVVYKPGKEMLIADCLSRAQLTECDELQGLSGVIHAVTKNVCVTEDNYNYYRKVMSTDEKYSRICKYVEDGWPTFHQLDNLSQQFHKLRADLHVENELLFYNHRLVVPSQLQSKIAGWLHGAHLGIEKTLARARMLYFWPGMNNQIKELIGACTVCEKFKRNNQREPLKQEETPEYPFHIMAMDLYEYAGRDFLAAIDSYSGYLVSMELGNKTSGHIIGKLREVFNKVGYPTVIKSDNVPFGSAEFERFAAECNTQLKFSSPRYPQSNGLAEKGVAIAKNILKRCYEVNEIDQFQYRILEYNTSPVASMGVTPSELFFGRLIKTRLPMCGSLLVRGNLSEKIIKQKIENKREKQKYYYDRNAKTLSVLNVGDLIIFKKNSREWNYGTIIGNVNGRSYIIRDSFDNHFRRNRRFIARTKNNGFNASDLLFEENIRSNVNHNNNNLENLKEIRIVTPTNNERIEDTTQENCEANEPELPVVVDVDTSVSLANEDETAGSYGSGAESEREIVSPPVTREFRTTRSGRVVRPPVRYGYE